MLFLDLYLHTWYIWQLKIPAVEDFSLLHGNFIVMKIAGKGNENIVKSAYCLMSFYLDYYDFEFSLFLCGPELKHYYVISSEMTWISQWIQKLINFIFLLCSKYIAELENVTFSICEQIYFCMLVVVHT